MRHLLLITLAMSLVACGGSPTSPSVPPATPGPSAAIHDTLNVTGSAAALDAVASERWSGTDRQVYDDFVSPTAAAIRTIVWQGMRPTRQAPARFYLSFIADDGGFPLRQQVDEVGRPRALYFSNFPIDVANERLGVTQACDNSPQQECGSYDYSIALTTPFAAAAGTRYWLFIQAESPLDAPSGWSWRKGQADNRFAMSNIAGAIFQWDMAFALRP